jgi:hypothetical protein
VTIVWRYIILENKQMDARKKCYKDGVLKNITRRDYITGSSRAETAASEEAGDYGTEVSTIGLSCSVDPCAFPDEAAHTDIRPFHHLGEST